MVNLSGFRVIVGLLGGGSVVSVACGRDSVHNGSHGEGNDHFVPLNGELYTRRQCDFQQGSVDVAERMGKVIREC